ncbi:MAG: 50S ribosomal protein L13 [Nanoarchaeota archaeon]|nr:50S ribosomal protein L13 [Nanoarchaeota archaeon]
MIVIDATDLILGRLASEAAKKAILGEDVRIINSENVFISGAKKRILNDTIQKRERGTHATGPHYPRYPDQIVKRTIRGMLPYKKPMGRSAFKRIKCFNGVPTELAKQTPITLEDANVSKLPNLKYMSLKTLSINLGAKLE